MTPRANSDRLLPSAPQPITQPRLPVWPLAAEFAIFGHLLNFSPGGSGEKQAGYPNLAFLAFCERVFFHGLHLIRRRRNKDY